MYRIKHSNKIVPHLKIFLFHITNARKLQYMRRSNANRYYLISNTLNSLGTLNTHTLDREDICQFCLCIKVSNQQPLSLVCSADCVSTSNSIRLTGESLKWQLALLLTGYCEKFIWCSVLGIQPLKSSRNNIYKVFFSFA